MGTSMNTIAARLRDVEEIWLWTELSDPSEIATEKPVAPVETPVEVAPIAQAAEVSESPAPAEAIQDTPVQADTWVEDLHVRMGRLTDDIHTLNARLDRLDERNKTTKA